MHNRSTAGRRAARLAPFAAAAVAAAAVAAPADAQTAASPIAVDAAHDAVVVTGLGPGRATLQVTRPDVDTAKPVAIGQYSAPASPGAPFSVNTTAPSLLKPAGDLSGLRAPAAIALRSVLAGKLKASFIVPTGARYVRARLARPGHTALLVIGPAATPGSRQTVRIAGPSLRKRLVRGRYTITVSAGPTKMRLGSPALRTTVLVE
jgi:hypothetical protein